MDRRGVIAHADVATVLAAGALGVWLLHPVLGWAVVAGALGVLAAVGAARAGRTTLFLAGLVAVLGAGAGGMTSWRVRAVEQHWGEVRERLIQGASRRLATTLGEAVGLARRLADRGALAASQSQAAAFDLLTRAAAPGGPEAGVVVLDADGRPWSWAGRHRLTPARAGGELYARITSFYVVLEARRQVQGRVAIGHVLLAADSAVPDREGTVAVRFARATGAELVFYAPGAAPLRTDVFDYCLPSCTPAPGVPPPDTLFSVRTLPPAQGPLKLELLGSGGRLVAWAALLTLALLLAAGGAATRYVSLGAGGLLLWLTPAAARAGFTSLFSPATYFLRNLGPLTTSAGALTVAGVLAIAGVVVLRTRMMPSRPAAVLGMAGLLAAPAFARWLAGGITPPAGGVSLALWVGWEIPLAVAAAAPVLVVGALWGRGGSGERSCTWAPWVAVGWAAGAAALGLWIWRPGGGLPSWYLYLWTPAIALVAWCGNRVRQVIAGAVVAGTAAALLTWTAAVDGRLRLARADMQQLKSGRDPVAVALLERLGSDLTAGPPPRTAADLYRRWRRSPLEREGYPAVLFAWRGDGTPLARLALADLDLPAGLLQALARSAAARRAPLLEDLMRVPGVHLVWAAPLADGSVVTVGIGPRTRLIRPFRVARFLRREAEAPAPYEMSLSEPTPGAGAEAAPAPGGAWRREGQVVRGEGRLDLPGGMRHLHVTLDLGEIPGLLVRGALLVFADVAAIVLLWLFGELVLGHTDFLRRLGGLLRLRSYRTRLAAALAVFFIVPTVGFAAWMAGRLQADTAQNRDLVIRQTLRDASGAVPEEGVRAGPAGDPLGAIADQVQTDLLLYQLGALRYSSAPLLAELGLLDVYLPPPVYRALVFEDALEVATDGMIGGREARVVFRTVSGPVRAQVLAAPRLADDRFQASGEGDLAFALLLVTLIGLGAAFALAGLAARSLARPVGTLRDAAAAVGRGETPRPFAHAMPEELVSVADAFTRMAEDVRASQAALEAARQRMAAVLRNVATGVLSLSGDARVNLANPRAEELLGAPLEPGGSIRETTRRDWAPVWDWVAARVAAGDDLASEEFTLGERRVRVQVSTLGADWGGCVVALDDITELAHAVRVLAWGELARQVAHEIKNPLTPIRLGIQHLQRAYRGSRGDFAAALDRTGRQILAEIDRLDAVARAFARFGAPPAEQQVGPLEAVDLVAVARETAALYALGGGTTIELEVGGEVRGRTRRDELKEVLVNLVENARDAGATRVTLAVRDGGAERVRIGVSDNGRGIPAEDVPRIFEPRFSTTTSGAGLGLAICKRLVESWGGTIGVASETGRGTTVTVDLMGA